MPHIPLSNGGFCLVDEEDLEWLSKYRWRASSRGRNPYAITTVRNGGWSKSVFMHKLILRQDDPYKVDHVNGNGLDNRRSNLRFCTTQQNSYNKRKIREGSHRYVGAVLRRRNGLWEAKLRAEKKVYYCGAWPTEIEAATARDRAALLMHGEFACLNFPGSEITPEHPSTLAKEAHAKFKSETQSKYYGVHRTRFGRFTAYAFSAESGGRVTLGNWLTEEQAAMAFDRAYKFFQVAPKFGLNFPGSECVASSPKELREEARLDSLPMDRRLWTRARRQSSPLSGLG
jgi:hypothetical protein